MSESKFAHSCAAEHAPKFLDWIRNRGGVAVWKSINLSNPSGWWSTPANKEDGTPMEKPSWQASNTPVIHKDPEQIGVYTEALFKAFRVGLRRSSSGFAFKLTDGAQRRLDAEMEKCREKHGDAFYRKGVLDIDGASMGVFYTTGEISLAEWERSQK